MELQTMRTIPVAVARTLVTIGQWVMDIGGFIAPLLLAPIVLPFHTLFVGMMVAGALTVPYVGYQFLKADPEPVTIEAMIPENADVYDASHIEPGTFEIVESLESFLAHAREGSFRPLVSYGHTLTGGQVQIIYWLAKGDGMFFKMTRVVPLPWPSVYKVGQIEWDGGQHFVAHPDSGAWNAIWLITIGVGWIFTGFFFLAMITD